MFGSDENYEYLKKVYKENDIFVVSQKPVIGFEGDYKVVTDTYSCSNNYWVLNNEYRNVYEAASEELKEMMIKEFNLSLFGWGYGKDNDNFPQNKPRDAYLDGLIKHPKTIEERKNISENLPAREV